MPRWTPEPLWAGSDAIIIGGGNSLRTFPWKVLKHEMTIGCNVAYELGKEICSLVLIGDRKFFGDHQKELKAYGGPVFTNARKLYARPPVAWLYTVKRLSRGLHTDALGWNGNTGASAINLAFLLGCPRVYLLGFDMQRTKTETNWHDRYKDDKKNRDNSYPKFIRAFRDVERDWREKFGDREIINVNDNSALENFPMMSVKDFLEERRKRCA